MPASHFSRISRAVAERGVAVGTSIGLGTAASVAIAADAGFDFVQVDGEHRHLPLSDVEAAAAVAAARDIAVLVRVPEITPVAVSHVLATGVTGVIAPHVETAEQVRRLVEYAGFPPVGSRSVGGRRSPHEPPGGTHAEHATAANARTLLWIIVESRAGVANLPGILAVGGVHAVLPGPFDLSFELGVPGQVDHPTVRREIEEIHRHAREHGVDVIGSHSTEPGGAEAAIRQGARLVLAPGDLQVLGRGHAANRADIDAAIAAAAPTRRG